jgi:hypothetical protein
MSHINTGDLHAQLSGASSINLSGSGDLVDISGSGASYTDLINYVGSNGYVNLSGASNGKINVQESLQVRLSGTSNLWYTGDPQVHVIEISGLARIIKL